MNYQKNIEIPHSVRNDSGYCMGALASPAPPTLQQPSEVVIPNGAKRNEESLSIIL